MFLKESGLCPPIFFDYPPRSEKSPLAENDMELFRLSTKVPMIGLRQAYLIIRRDRADVVTEYAKGDGRIQVVSTPIYQGIVREGLGHLRESGLAFGYARIESDSSFSDIVPVLLRSGFELAALPGRLFLHPSAPGLRFTLEPRHKDYFEDVVEGRQRVLSEDGIEAYFREASVSKPKKIYLTFPKRFAFGATMNAAVAATAIYLGAFSSSPFASHSIWLNTQVGPVVRAIMYFPDRHYEARVKELDQAISNFTKDGNSFDPKSRYVFPKELIPIALSEFERREAERLSGTSAQYTYQYFFGHLDALMSTRDVKVFQYFEAVLLNPNINREMRFEVLGSMRRYRTGAEMEKLGFQILDQIIPLHPEEISDFARRFHGIFYKWFSTSPETKKAMADWFKRMKEEFPEQDPWSDHFRKTILETILTLRGEDHSSQAKTEALERITYALHQRDATFMGLKSRIEASILRDYERGVSPKSLILYALLNLHSSEFKRVLEEVLSQGIDSKNPSLPDTMDEFYPIVGRAQAAGLDSLTAVQAALEKARAAHSLAKGARQGQLRRYILQLESIEKSLKSVTVRIEE